MTLWRQLLQRVLSSGICRQVMWYKLSMFRRNKLFPSEGQSVNEACNRQKDRRCGLVVIVPGYRTRGPGSIPGATRFSEKQWVWNGVHTASWVQLRSSGLVNRDYGHRVPPHWSSGTLYPQKLAVTSPTSGGRSVGIVRSRTQATEFSFFNRQNQTANS
jgi:hypothetical protein